MTYSGTSRFSKSEYTGETGQGIDNRLRQHVHKGEKGKNKAKLYRFMKGIGAHQMTWTPSFMWKNCVEKYRRMREEGRTSYERASRLNELGTERIEDKQSRTGLLVLGRRKRFRLATRLARLVRGDKLVVGGT